MRANNPLVIAFRIDNVTFCVQTILRLKKSTLKIQSHTVGLSGGGHLIFFCHRSPCLYSTASM